jgi:hypothetical protein
VPRIDIRTRITGLREVLRALDRLPDDAQREARQGAVRLSRLLANRIRAAGRASSRQSARASRTVRTATDGNNPAVVAGPHPLLFGSNFGARGRFGWYLKPRYWHSPARQFRPWVGQGGNDYWYFSTVDREQPEIAREHRSMLDAIVRSWSA